MEKIIQLPRREIVKLLLDETHQQFLKKKPTNNFLKEESKYLNDRKIIIKEHFIIMPSLHRIQLSSNQFLLNLKHKNILKLSLN